MANLRPIDSAPLSLTLAQLKGTASVSGPAARASNLSDDEPLYDAVASDDDYAALAPVAQQVKFLMRQKAVLNHNHSFG